MYGRSDVLINQVLLDRVLKIKHNQFIHDDSYDLWKEELIEKIKLTRLGEMVESLNEDEIAVMVVIAIEKYPELVFRIMMEEYLVNKERKKDKNENRKNV